MSKAGPGLLVAALAVVVSTGIGYGRDVPLRVASVPPSIAVPASAEAGRPAQNTPTQCITYVSPNVPLDVPTPPDTAGVVNSTLTVPHSFTITDVNVGPLNFTHSFLRDLDVVLFGPGGGVILFEDIGPAGPESIVDLVLDDEAATPVSAGSAPFTGRYQPVGSLAAFDGQPSFGIWRLQVTDDEFLDTGVLQSWSLQLCGFPGAGVVVPNVRAATEGNSNNAVPFDAGSFRYQQVYDASQLPRHPARITQIAFRPDNAFGEPFSATGIDAEIRLAHTDSQVNALDNTFANNLDRNVTLVYDGPLKLSSADSGGPPPDFDVVIGLNQTFIYNGLDNLLLEVKIFNVPSTTIFDAESGSTSVSRIVAYNPNAAEADPSTDNNLGLVTRFTMDVDTDSDACVDAREIGANAAQGGRRDPKVFWDFFDTPDPTNRRDGIVSTGDIQRLVTRFGTTGTPAGDPLTPPPPSGYHTAFDRTPADPGDDLWDLNPPDGVVAVNDILLMVYQFAHTCVL